MTKTNTILDDFLIEMHHASDRMMRAPVACVVPTGHPIAQGKHPSIYGLSAAYDPGLTPGQGVIFFSDHDAFQRYCSQIKK